ncbi:hypothetical protein [Saccharopolyspora pogona]|uniref:hypothetical protein n=1 Tax=Saccharopolyspora pogona TaxID=333966 RepID=UPI001687818C|nr:hypothetical protein [Saccharopolyspora pogona]
MISLLFGWFLIWMLTQGLALFFHGSNEDHNEGKHGSLSTGIHADAATFRHKYLPLSLNLTKRSLIFLAPWVSISFLLTWNLRSGEYLRVLEAGNPFDIFAWSVFNFCLSSVFVWLLLQSVVGPVTFLAYTGQLILLLTGYIFRNDHPTHPIRWVAYATVATGFLLDLLAS